MAARLLGNLVWLITGSIFAVGVRADWMTYQADAAHTGYVPGIQDWSGGAHDLWTQTQTTNYMGAAISNGTVYETIDGTTTPNLYAMDARTGSVLWSNGVEPFAPGGITVSSPSIANGKVYYQTDTFTGRPRGGLRAFDAATGAVYLSAAIDAGQSFTNPTIVNNRLFTNGGTGSGQYSYNATTGALNWTVSADGSQFWSPAVDSTYNYNYQRENSGGSFRMINNASGAIAYLVTDPNFAVGDVGYRSVVLGAKKDAFAVNGSSGRITRYNVQADATHTPGVAWVRTAQFDGQASYANGTVYAHNGTGIRALDENTGGTFFDWSPPAGETSFGPMIVTDNTLFTTSVSNVYAISLSTHQTIWSMPIDGSLSYTDYPMALSDNILFVGHLKHLVAIEMPEPTSLSLLGVGLILAMRRRREAR